MHKNPARQNTGSPGQKEKVIGKEISTPGTADGPCIGLIVVVLVTVTKALYPRVGRIVLRG